VVATGIDVVLAIGAADVQYHVVAVVDNGAHITMIAIRAGHRTDHYVLLGDTH
jgi:hypothetical protein